jgi:phospholipase C
MIESTFGLHPLTARDANAMDLRQVLRHQARHPVPQGLIPASSQVPGPATDAAAVCSAASVQSVSPPPASKGKSKPGARLLPQSGHPTRTGMGELAHRHSQGTTR